MVCVYTCVIMFVLWFYITQESLSSNQEPLSIEESKELMGKVAQLQFEKAMLEEKVMCQAFYGYHVWLSVKLLAGNHIHPIARKTL